MLTIKSNSILSLQKGWELLNLNRSTIYYKPIELSTANTALMNNVYEIWLQPPFYGYRKITAVLKINFRNKEFRQICLI